MHPLVKDMRGLKFGKLTPIEYVGGPNGKWLCECDCGNECEVPSYNLRRTDRPTISCGCIRPERIKKHGHTKLEGHWKSPTYRTWCKMKDRCLNPDERMAQYYNKEMLCERWYQFENFLEDMGERPDGCEIHRVDNDKGYSPDNCEWKDRILHRQEHVGL
jgi:hypothetical protein